MFLDEVKATISTTPRCGVAKWLATQADLTDRELREAAGQFSVAATHRAMIARGYDLSRTTVERHIAGVCSCPGS